MPRRPVTNRIFDVLLVALLVSSARSNSLYSSDEDDVDVAPASSSSTFTDQWAVHISGGDEVADAIAAKHGFTNLGKIFGDYYHFQHRKVAKRSIEPGTHHNDLLNGESEVRWVQQQVVKRRVKRDLLDLDEEPHDVKTRWERSRNDRGRPSRRVGSSSIRSVTYSMNDPRWAQMWYLNRGAGLDMNVQEAWAEGVTGKGTVVTILDDGLEKDHPDIRRNYDPLASYDVNNNDEDPMPRYDLVDSNRHGTRCAGEVAAEANNSICAVGIAFRAGIGGVRMLDGEVTDAVEARSLSLNPQHIDIYSASWGPDDDGKTVDGPGELAMRAFIEGVTKGRGGKGSIFVWASGNGGRDRDNCNCDGYTNSIWTLSISSATENGYVPWYSEACSSTLATTYSSGSSGEKQIVTTDLHHSCTASHTGTSASAPLAAGICALALEANPGLTWRDMQHIVVRTAKPANLKADDWQTNGVGRNVSHSFGYGLMDAAAMVRLARSWPTVPQQRYCEIRAPDSNKLIPAKSQIKLQLVVRECDGVNFMEHLQARITLAAVSRGDIQIHLSSPSGTRSTLLALRPHDSSRNGFHSWPFMSVHYWGESPFGAWVLEIQNEGRYLATLSDWNVIVYGTKEAPGPKKPEPTSTTTTTTTTTTVKAPVTTAASAPVPEVPDVIAERPVAHPAPTSNRIDDAEQEKERGASVAAVVGPQNVPLTEPVRVVSSASVHCRPGHWDAAAAACLMCDSETYLLDGKCVTNCPDAFFTSSRTDLTGSLDGICIPCHYTCLTCTGPSDSECLTCHADAQLKSVNVPGPKKDKTESYCHPRELVSQLANYERWSLGVELALALNVACLVALMVYLTCTRNNCRWSLPSFCGGIGEKSGKSDARYHNLMSYQYQKRGSVEYSDSKSASTGIDVPAAIIENDEEELSD